MFRKETGSITVSITEQFSFGKNWEEFVKTRFNEERVANAQQQLLGSLMLPDLKGMVFLDIGCGSGLHSLAAFRAGAQKIISFDYDPDSVRTAQYLHKTAGSPAHWSVQQGSVLDIAFMKNLPKADIVYSWGVLHHTGHVWQAIENACLPLKVDGTFFMALYSHTCYENAVLNGHPSPDAWLGIKQAYNRASRWGKRRMEYAYVLTSGFTHSLWNPLATLRSIGSAWKQARTYHKSRGMDYWTDVRDWLGGWPMEFVKEQDCLSFCRKKLSLECLRLLTGQGNTEYIFRRTGSTNYWDLILASSKTGKLAGPFQYVSGHAWCCDLPEMVGLASDTNEMPRRSPVVLLEDGLPLAFAHSSHEAIGHFGAGRYSHWDHKLYFSSSDNSDPNTRRHHYEITWSTNGA
jgi:cyclopropane fatty-acyl-phospholipid synthase-like methyltransferase